MPAAAGSASSDIKKFENAQPDLFRILNFIKENAQKPVVEALKDVNAAKWEQKRDLMKMANKMTREKLKKEKEAAQAEKANQGKKGGKKVRVKKEDNILKWAEQEMEARGEL